MKRILFVVSIFLLVSCTTKKHNDGIASQPSMVGSQTGGVGATYPAEGLDGGTVAYETEGSPDIPVVDNNALGTSKGAGVAALYGVKNDNQSTSLSNNDTSYISTNSYISKSVEMSCAPKITSGYFGAINGGAPRKNNDFLYLGSAGREGYLGATNIPRDASKPRYGGGVPTAYAKLFNPELVKSTYYGATYNENVQKTSEPFVSDQVTEVVKSEEPSSTIVSESNISVNSKSSLPQPSLATSSESQSSTKYTYTYHGSKEVSSGPSSAGNSIIEQNKNNASLEYADENPKASYSWNSQNNGSKTPDSADCEKAKSEVASASKTEVLADKLFYYRKALRLCPESAEYHNGLGEVFLILNRKDDAEMEFQEALKIDPSLESAQNNLKIIRNSY